MDFVLSLLVTIAAFSALWAVHLAINNLGIVDVYWGAGFVVISAVYALRVGQLSPYQLMFIAMIVAWAVRLSFYLIRRFVIHNNEDARYTAMRASSGPSFWWASLPKIFVLQALVMWIIATPVHTALTLPIAATPNGLFLGSGIALFCAGLAIETIADHQLAQFKLADPKSTKLLRTGLWGWSRHPNYFGEALLWWGLGIFALALTGSLFALLGPFVLTTVLIGITGRLTDGHLKDSRAAAFSSYEQQTSGFVPLPPAFYQLITKKSRPIT